MTNLYVCVSTVIKVKLASSFTTIIANPASKSEVLSSIIEVYLPLI